jgi:hypothetical protein
MQATRRAAADSAKAFVKANLACLNWQLPPGSCAQALQLHSSARLQVTVHPCRIHRCLLWGNQRRTAQPHSAGPLGAILCPVLLRQQDGLQLKPGSWCLGGAGAQGKNAAIRTSSTATRVQQR